MQINEKQNQIDMPRQLTNTNTLLGSIWTWKKSCVHCYTLYLGDTTLLIIALSLRMLVQRFIPEVC